jgi:hypothetical protein
VKKRPDVAELYATAILIAVWAVTMIVLLAVGVVRAFQVFWGEA